MDRTEIHIYTRQKACVWRDGLQKPLRTPYITLYNSTEKSQGSEYIIKKYNYLKGEYPHSWSC